MIRQLLNTELKSIENDGIHVDHVKHFKTRNEVPVPFIISNFSVLLIKSGKLSIAFSSGAKVIRRKDLLLIPVNSTCTKLEASVDIQLYLIRTSFDFAFYNCYEKELADAFSFLMMKSEHSIKLHEKDFKVLSLIYKLMHVLQNGSEKPELINQLRRICFNLFIYELKMIHSKYAPDINLAFSRRESIVIQFLTILAIHVRKQHHVQFYAGALFVTPGHLNKMVKEITGRSAKTFIIEALINVSKLLLADSDYSVAKIADELEFSSAENFGVFFKRHTGLLPTEFRSKKNNNY
ncbi:helix-turn-helix domain-containing protein [Flavobacterium plurextorum]|uniref:helix-turn-helix domain-containing protein n=1 Tax=Flavobacterium TaxID=237 RepID=UPI00214D5391|nr:MULTISPECIES: helix-turn-helix domain-containing protein [Flavobacterium]UUW08640.1 helix-turn-helix domain-containing protein [Flavobacterium plurextorum]